MKFITPFIISNADFSAFKNTFYYNCIIYMLISSEEIIKLLLINKINISGSFHIGAHDCEELHFYNEIGLIPKDVIWIDAIPSKVTEAINKGIPNVYNAVITDKDDKEIIFNVSNNIQSSSVLEFGTHSQEHSHIIYVDKIKQKSITVDTFFERNNIDASKYNFWNFDIQGAELMALKGATQSIKYAKAIYLEVNEKELYKDCGLINDLDNFLSQYNFKRVLTKMTTHGWGDALYILDN
jgi:FkbM family methyltransferase